MRRIAVGPRPARRAELERRYVEALAAQAASGLSVAELAGRMGVSVPTLCMWRRRLGSRRRTTGLPAKLVEVTVARPASPALDTGSARMVVRVCSGRRSIGVPA